MPTRKGITTRSYPKPNASGSDAFFWLALNESSSLVITNPPKRTFDCEVVVLEANLSVDGSPQLKA